MDLFARRTFLKGAAAIALATSAPALFDIRRARAQATDGWPNRPVRFIVPLAPGGGLDFIARMTGDHLSRGLGQQVVIENKTGAGGTIGIESAIKSAPDGYSVLISNDNVASAPHILKLPTDYAKDLVPVIQLARQPLAFAAHPSLGVNSLTDVVALAKERRGIGCATSGVGSNQHVLLEWFNQTAGINLAHVPYRGAGQAVNDLVAGHVPLGLLGPTALIPHTSAGTLRMLAQSSQARSPSLPEVPTFEQAGFKGLVLDIWYGAFVPTGTPPAIVARLNTEMNKAMADAANRKNLLQTANEPVGGSADAFARLVREDSDKYARLVRQLDIKAS